MEEQTTMSFLRWLFKDSHKSLSFWGFVTVILSVVMLIGGCPGSWPFYIMILGVVMTTTDAVLSWYRYSRLVYQLEQEQIVRDLKKD